MTPTTTATTFLSGLSCARRAAARSRISSSPTRSTRTTCDLPHRNAYVTADSFFTYLRDAFDVLYAEGAEAPRMMSIGMHCRLLGRPGRFVALQRFLDHVAAHDRVWVARRIDIARHWTARHPFAANARGAQ